MLVFCICWSHTKGFALIKKTSYLFFWSLGQGQRLFTVALITLLVGISHLSKPSTDVTICFRTKKFPVWARLNQRFPSTSTIVSISFHKSQTDCKDIFFSPCRSKKNFVSGQQRIKNQEAHQHWNILEPLHFAQNYPSSVSKNLQSRCKVQDPAPHLSFYQSSCHHPSQYFFELSSVRGSSSCLPSLFDHTVFDLLLSKFIKIRHTDGAIWTKDNLLVPFDGVFDGFIKLFFCFHTVSTWYIQHFGKF